MKKILLVASILLLSAGNALAGSEDTELFQVDCNGYNSKTGAYRPGSRCVASLLGARCIYNEDGYRAEGNDAYVAKRGANGTWQRVSPVTHYDSCAEEAENGKNRKMRFRVGKKTATYGIFLDVVGDDNPAYRERVLAVGTVMASDQRSFKIKVK